MGLYAGAGLFLCRGHEDKLSDEDWGMFYAGNDGTVTFYIDLVNGTFARSSLSEVYYPIDDLTIDEMFQVIQKEVENETA